MTACSGKTVCNEDERTTHLTTKTYILYETLCPIAATQTPEAVPTNAAHGHGHGKFHSKPHNNGEKEYEKTVVVTHVNVVVPVTEQPEEFTTLRSTSVFFTVPAAEESPVGGGPGGDWAPGSPEEAMSTPHVKPSGTVGYGTDVFPIPPVSTAPIFTGGGGQIGESVVAAMAAVGFAVLMI